MTVWLYDLSFSGTTAGIADRIAAVIDVVRAPVQPASGKMPDPKGIGIFFGGMMTLLGTKRPARPLSRPPGPDDIVILGSPVWAARLPPLMRGFLDHLEPRPKRWIAFMTLGGSGADTALAELTERMGSEPIASLAITAQDIETGADATKLAGFIGQLREALMDPPTAPPTASPAEASD